MSSRQRMLAALSCQQPDHVPCAFMLYNTLKGRCSSYAEFIERQLAMGLDTVVELPLRPPVVANDYYNLHGLPVNYDPRVTVKEWVEERPGEASRLMVKEYHTPAGVLRTEVSQTSDWRWGDHVPFLDDYLIPRSLKFLVTGAADLPALRYLLVPPTPAEIAAFHLDSQPALALARQRDLLVAGGWGVGADLVGWIYGLEQMAFAVYDDPEMLSDMLDIIAAWNRQRMQVVLEAGVDLYIKRAWYENLDFWTPRSWRKFIYPILADDVALAHQHGAKFGYLITSSCMPLLPMFAELGIDVLIGVDPMQWNLAEAKQKLGGKVALWGGVNGHLTVEQGSPEQVRAAVGFAMHELAPGGGLILSPVDNVREDTPTAQTNVAALIDEWRRLICL
jgi:Uroporphyrinogen decarboxylase (URO-D)